MATPKSRRPTAQQKEQFLNEMLSPVSKLERARQQAALEQKKRIEMACNRRVAEKRLNSVKRKIVQSQIASGIKRKVQRLDLEEPMPPMVKATTRSRGAYFETGVPPGMRNSSTGMRSRDNYVEGDQIRSAILQGSGKKRIVKNPNESVQAYALRAAAIRKQERETAKAAETIKNMDRGMIAPQEEESVHGYAVRAALQRKKDREAAALLKQRDQQEQIAYIDDEEEDEEIEQYEEEKEGFDSSMLASVPMKQTYAEGYYPESMEEEEEEEFHFEDEIDVEEEEESAPTTSRFRSLLFFSLVSFIALSCFVYFSSTKEVRYCDVAGAESLEDCIPCPPHAKCEGGNLISCIDPFVVSEQDDGCVPSGDVYRNADRMAKVIQTYLVNNADKFFCPSYAFWLESEDLVEDWETTETTTVKHSDVEGLVRAKRTWKSSPAKTFDVTLSNAIDLLGSQYGAHVNAEGDIELGLADCSWKCRGARLLYKYVWSISLLVGLLFVSWGVLLSVRRKDEDKKLVEAIVYEVHEKLIDQSKASHEDLQGFPVDHLRDYIFDQVGASGANRSRFVKNIWPAVERQIRHDSRIRQREVKHRGRSSKIWEWISHDAAKSSARNSAGRTSSAKRRQARDLHYPEIDESNNVRKTLNFAEQGLSREPFTTANPVQLS